MIVARLGVISTTFATRSEHPMQHRDVKFILGGLLAQVVATLWIGSAYALPTDARVGGTDGPATSVVITPEAGQTPYFQRAELGPPENGGAQFGTAVAVWRDTTTGIRWAVIGAPGDNSSEGAVYLLQLVPGADQWHQTARITPSDGQPGDGFGQAVAIQNNTIAVGSPGHTASGHVKAGQAYLYTVDYTTSAVTESGRIYGAASDNANSGTSIALAGNIVFVGAPNALTHGAVWVGLQSGGTWTFTQSVIPTGTLDGYSFGRSLAMDGARLVVGMPNDSSGGESSGLAFTFVNRGGAWSQESQLSAPDASAYNHFGSSVAIYGDAIAVGARDHDAAKGAVYSFQFNRTASTWDYKSTLVQTDAAQFGFAVSLSSGMLAVGAPGTGTTSNGAVYVFDGSPDSWTPTDRFPKNDIAGQYGAAVAINESLFLTGAPNRYVHGSYRGGAISYTYDLSTTTPQREITAMGAANEQFGAAVAISGDTAVVEAPSKAVDGAAANVASIFLRDSTGKWKWQSDIARAPGDYSIDLNYCPAAAISGDTMLIGDPGQAVGGVEQGGAFVWRRHGDTWQRESNLVFLGGAAGDGFGCTVAISGDTAVIGAPGTRDASGHTRVGSAYVFTRTGSTWFFSQALDIPDSGADHMFGAAVGISGTTLVVGAPYNGQGALYVYTQSAGAWTLKKEILAPSTSGHFGAPLAIDGKAIAAGAPLADGGNGEVDIYVGSGASWTLQSQLPAPDHQTQFGGSLSLQGDALIVGHRFNNQAFVYKRVGTAWNLHATLASDSGGYFGTAVGTSNGNIIVSGPQEEGGRAYIFQADGIFSDSFE